MTEGLETIEEMISDQPLKAANGDLLDGPEGVLKHILSMAAEIDGVMVLFQKKNGDIGVAGNANIQTQLYFHTALTKVIQATMKREVKKIDQSGSANTQGTAH